MFKFSTSPGEIAELLNYATTNDLDTLTVCQPVITDFSYYSELK